MEENIKNKLLNASAPVPPRLWEALEERLAPEEKRKPAAWHWAAAASLVLMTLLSVFMIRQPDGLNVSRRDQSQAKVVLTSPAADDYIIATNDQEPPIELSAASQSIGQQEVKVDGKKRKASKTAPAFNGRSITEKAIHPKRHPARAMPAQIVPAPLILVQNNTALNRLPDTLPAMALNQPPPLVDTTQISTPTTRPAETKADENAVAYAEPESITFKSSTDPAEVTQAPQSKVQKLKHLFNLAGKVASGELTARNALKQEGVPLEWRIPLPN